MISRTPKSRYRQNDLFKLSILALLGTLLGLRVILQPEPITSIPRPAISIAPEIIVKPREINVHQRLVTRAADTPILGILEPSNQNLKSEKVALSNRVITYEPGEQNLAANALKRQATKSPNMADNGALSLQNLMHGDHHWLQLSLSIIAPMIEQLEIPAPNFVFPAQGAEIPAGSLTLIGTGIPGTTVQGLDFGIEFGTTTVADNSEWHLTFQPALGNHLFAVRYLVDQAQASDSIAVKVLPVHNSYRCDSNPGINRDTTYIVGTCETICTISENLGLTCEALISQNPHLATPDYIFPGQIIYVPQ